MVFGTAWNPCWNLSSGKSRGQPALRFPAHLERSCLPPQDGLSVGLSTLMLWFQKRGSEML